MNDTILVVEDDPVLRRSIAQTLTFENINIIEASTYTLAKNHIHKDLEGIVLTDIRMEGKDGFDLLKLCQSIDPELPVIMLTGEGDVPMAVHAIRNGAFEFLEKPCHPDNLLPVLKKALRQRHLIMQNRKLQNKLKQNDAAAKRFPGTSIPIRYFRSELRKFANLPVNVHFWGEAGVGKNLAAQSLQDLSEVSQQIDDYSLGHSTPELMSSLMEDSGNRFVIFRDIESATIEQQELLASFINKNKNTRVITTSNVELDDIAKSKLCHSLFFLISVAQIEVPALRNRAEDILPTFQSMLLQHAELMQIPIPNISSKIITEITNRIWTGNLSELRLFAQKVILKLDDTDFSKSNGNGLNDRLNAYEKTILIDALTRHKGRTAKVASELVIPLKTIYDRLKRHGLKSSSFR